MCAACVLVPRCVTEIQTSPSGYTMPGSDTWSARVAQIFASLWALFGQAPVQNCVLDNYAALGASFSLGIVVGAIFTATCFACSCSSAKPARVHDEVKQAKPHGVEQGLALEEKSSLGEQRERLESGAAVQLKSSPRHSAETEAIVRSVRRSSAHKRSDIHESPVATLRKRHAPKSDVKEGGGDEVDKRSTKERLKELHLRRILNEKKRSPPPAAQGELIKQVSQ